MRRLAVYLIAFSLALPHAALAQQPAPEQPATELAAPAVDASKMGVSLDRIRRELRESEGSAADGSLRFNYRVEVFGQAPKINFLEGFPLTGPTPNSAPTHREFIDFVTPPEYRRPAFPIYGLAVWAVQKLHERSARTRCEQEIADYRALLMQGVNVAAPRCTQQ